MQRRNSQYCTAEAVAEIAALELSAADEAYEQTLGFLGTADEDTLRRYVDYITGGDHTDEVAS